MVFFTYSVYFLCPRFNLCGFFFFLSYSVVHILVKCLESGMEMRWAQMELEKPPLLIENATALLTSSLSYLISMSRHTLTKGFSSYIS